jgi:hypothetical protein
MPDYLALSARIAAARRVADAALEDLRARAELHIIDPCDAFDDHDARKAETAARLLTAAAASLRDAFARPTS